MTDEKPAHLTTQELIIKSSEINEESINLILEYQHQIDHQEQVIQELSKQVVFLKSLRWWQRPIAAFYGEFWEARHNAMARTNRRIRRDIDTLVQKVIDLEEELDQERRS